MTAATKNLIIEQKATWKKRMTWRDKLKRPISLIGYGARMQIRNAAGDLIADLSTSNSKITLGGSAGTIDLLLTVSETSTMTPVPMLYDLKLVAPDGSEVRMLQGKITLSIGQTE